MQATNGSVSGEPVAAEGPAAHAADPRPAARIAVARMVLLIVEPRIVLPLCR
jgi:hypothetical protein